ncbi:MAG: succinate dehydrogenase assembly factor 2 [Gammaproteobacteria bacterium]|jgi:antitoxin CptB|nr:succinate dehydrogenase assembly factor 2 [Gammaproteobacteria bacterium]
MNPESAELSRIRWRCRRGTKELDLLLLSYFENYYELMDDVRKKRFDQLLMLQDPVIIDMFAAPKAVEDPNIRIMVIEILGSDQGLTIE